MRVGKSQHKVAIVGSGPSGFYAAEALLQLIPAIEVSMIERLPAPFGLVRYGVAPDHPKLKQPIAIYEKIAASERFHLFCNVKLGSQVQLDELRLWFDAVILAFGADKDCRLNIPGEDLPGNHTATEFVGWYNAHPDYRDRRFDLSRESVAIIGHGNVALDVARILLKTPDELHHTDIAAHAFDVLAASRVRNIHIIGRRGPTQARFTPQELSEFGKLADAVPIVDSTDLDLNEASCIEVADKMSRAIAGNIKILSAFASSQPGSAKRRCYFHFLKNPVAIAGKDRVQSIILARNRLAGEPFHQIAKQLNDQIELKADLVFRSIGYRGSRIPGLPFAEDRGVIPTKGGQVIGLNGAPLDGVFASGWIKRGASGTIGSNRADSVDVVTTLQNELTRLGDSSKSGMKALAEHLRAQRHDYVDYAKWKLIDEAEVLRGHEKGKPREKFTRSEEMLRIAQGTRTLTAPFLDAKRL